MKKNKKFLLKMKLTIYLSLFAVLQVTASSYSQTKMSMDLKNVQILEVFKAIEEQSDFDFFYENSQVNSELRVSINSNNATIKEILDQVFNGTDLSYVILEKDIVIVPKTEEEMLAEKLALEKITLKGKVTDSEGIPLPGATVLEEGTLNGTTTNPDGTYTLEVAGINSSIKVSFIGFTTQIIKVGDKAEINIVLLESAESLKEVVVTGYQTLSKERTTGSFAVISEDDMASRVTTNVVDRLEGLVPGLSLDKDNNIMIRGISTMYGNAFPLIVVDGFPIDGDINTVNPEDIKSLTVLKDAAAASIWGTRAANGVIVITTKDGKQSKGVEVTTSFYRTISMKQSVSDLQLMNTSDRIDMELDFWDNYYTLPSYMWYVENNRFNTLHELYRRRYSTMVPTDKRISENEYQSELSRLRNVDGFKQFEDYLLRNAIQDQANLTLTSASENNSFVGSFAYNSDNSTSVGDHSSRMVINLKNDLKISDRINFGIATNLVYTKQKNNGLGTTFFDQYLGLAQYEQIINENGERNQIYFMNFMFRDSHDEMGLNYSYNPIDVVEANDNTTKGLSTRIQLKLDAKITDDIKFSSKYQYEINYSRNENHRSVENPAWRNILNDYYVDGEYILPYGGRMDMFSYEISSWTLRNQIDFNRNFNNGKHQITAIIGNEIRSYSYSSSSAQILGYDPQIASGLSYDALGFQNYSVRNRYGYMTFYETAFPDVNYQDNRDVSYYVNLSYKLNKKYNFSLSYRLDQANIFGFDSGAKNNKLWSTGFSWDMHKESFMKKDWIDRFTLRATYGVNGNRPNPNITAYLTGYVRAGDSFGPFDQKYIDLVNPENSALRSEKVYTSNFGIDFSFFKGILRGTLDYYNKISKDLIGPNAINPTNGWEASMINYAEMKNQGIELGINVTPIKTQEFTWNLGLNFSYNKNEITNVYANPSMKTNLEKPVNSEYDSRAGLPVKGYPIGRIFAYRWGGLDSEGLPQIINGDGETISYRDAVWADDLMEYQGTSVAPYYGSITNSFKYNNITLGLIFTYKLGHKMRAPISRGLYDATMSYSPIHESYANYWKNPGDENNTDVPAMRSYNLFEMWYYQGYYVNADINVLDASQIRLSDINIDYNIPSSLLKKIGIKEATLRLQVKNIWRWSANKWNLDSEAFEAKDEYFSSVYTSGFSLPKTIIMGLKVKF